MTTFTTLADSTLSQDKPVTQSMTRAFRDNPIAIAEGDASAPRVAIKAIDAKYFMAKRTTTQSTSLSTTHIKVQCNSEDYDPDNLYDNATNYRFTPDKPGLYLVHGYVEGSTAGVANGVQIAAHIYKNGSAFVSMPSSGNLAATKACVLATALVQMNGSTDYLELYVSFPGDATGGCSLTAARFFAVGQCEI